MFYVYHTNPRAVARMLWQQPNPGIVMIMSLQQSLCLQVVVITSTDKVGFWVSITLKVVTLTCCTEEWCSILYIKILHIMYNAVTTWISRKDYSKAAWCLSPKAALPDNDIVCKMLYHMHNYGSTSCVDDVLLKVDRFNAFYTYIESAALTLSTNTLASVWTGTLQVIWSTTF